MDLVVQGFALLRWYGTVTCLLANGSAAFIWKVHSNWLKHLWQPQNSVVMEGLSLVWHGVPYHEHFPQNVLIGWRKGDAAPGGRLNIKYHLTCIGIPMLKIRRSRDLLIFNMGIPYLERWFYIETGPRALAVESYLCCTDPWSWPCLLMLIKIWAYSF